MRRFPQVAASAAIAASLVVVPSAASAYVTSGLLVYLDATNSSSFTNVNSAWQDLSSNNVDGTFVGEGITYDSSSQSIEFPGGPHDTAWVELDTSTEKFDDFSDGFSIEFEGEFGATRAAWERIFDFSEDTDNDPGDGETLYSFWLGQYGGSNELALEIFDNGVRQGYCHTSTGSTSGTDGSTGTALGVSGSRDFSKWIVTIDTDANNTCKIYKDGVSLPVLLHTDANTTYTANSGSTSGVAFTLPPTVNRESALIGGSNFTADADFEGRIRYIRVYDETLSASEVEENTGTSSSSTSGSSSSKTTDEEGEPGIFITVTGRPGREFEGTEAIYGSYAILPFSPYQVTLQSISDPTVFKNVLASGRVNSGGHLERTLSLPQVEPGSYKIILMGTGTRGELLRLTNHVNVDSAGKFSSVSPERLQPLLP